MNKRTAYQLGIESGRETAMYGDFTADELASEASFIEACCEIFENKRQYAGDVSYDMARERNSESLFNAYDSGEIDGAMREYNRRTGYKGESNPLV